jgi:hypothetical protein
MRNRYPKGIDVAVGATSTKLEPIDIPPPTRNSVSREVIDTHSKYDRTDLQSPWNRYLEYKNNDSLAYQRHLGFHERKFAPGQVLAARRKEQFLKKICEEEKEKEKRMIEEAMKEKMESRRNHNKNKKIR